MHCARCCRTYRRGQDLVAIFKEQRRSECRYKGAECGRVQGGGGGIQGSGEGQSALQGHPERINRESAWETVVAPSVAGTTIAALQSFPHFPLSLGQPPSAPNPRCGTVGSGKLADWLNIKRTGPWFARIWIWIYLTWSVCFQLGYTLRFQQQERKGIYFRKRELQEQKKGGEKCWACLRNKGSNSPAEQKLEEELMSSERDIAWETGALDGGRRRLSITRQAVGSCWISG